MICKKCKEREERIKNLKEWIGACFFACMIGFSIILMVSGEGIKSMIGFVVFVCWTAFLLRYTN